MEKVSIDQLCDDILSLIIAHGVEILNNEAVIHPYLAQRGWTVEEIEQYVNDARRRLKAEL